MLIEITVSSSAPHNKVTSGTVYDEVTSKFREVLFAFGITLGGREVKPTRKVGDSLIAFFLDVDDINDFTQEVRQAITRFMLKNIGADAQVSFGTDAQEKDNTFTLLLNRALVGDGMSCFVLEGDRSSFSPQKAQMFMGVVKAQYRDNFKLYPLRNMLGKNIGIYKVTYNDNGLVTHLERIKDTSKIAKENFFNIIFSEVEKYDE